jgi:gamma-glutamyltranspeptidase/glutathione hydrolase
MNFRVSFIIATLLIITSCSTTILEPRYHLVDIPKTEKKSDHEKWGTEYSIAAQGKYASLAGQEMFEKGGNIIDAFAAVSFVISVERPQSTGIGGGGFLLYYDHEKRPGGSPITVDFREKAPLKAHKKMYLDRFGNEIPKKSIDGIFAAGVPGLVAGVLDMHKEHGKLPLETIMAPAIKLAKEGFLVYPELAKALKYRAEILKRFKASRKIFTRNGEVLKLGDRLVQKDLARTLTTIAKKGKDGFYKGWVAKAIVNEHRRLKGLITMEDLKKYNVKYRDPIIGTYKGHKVFSMSPPSSGGVHIIQILNILEKDDLKSYGVQHPKTIHLTASAMQRAFADRAEYLGDTDFVRVPVKGLTSKKYAKDIRFAIPESQALNETWSRDQFKSPFKYESPETTHFTIMDKKGNVAVSTQTINGYFGSAVVVPGTGILLNNEMDDFSTKPGAKNLFGAVGSKKNLVEPEKRPLSSMSPTIVLKDDKPVLALGTPSGTRILTCVAQTILNYIEHDLPLYDSVMATRFHHQWNPNEIRIEEKGLPKKTIKSLKRMKHQLNFKNFGCRIQAIANEDGKLHGVSDARGRGLVSTK